MKATQLETLFRRTDKRILPHPSNSSLLVRQCRIDAKEEDPYAVVNYAQCHLAKVAVCGVMLPSFSFHVMPSNIPEKERHTNAEAFAVVERIQGPTLAEALHDPKEAQQAAIALTGLKTSLHRYARWAYETDQPHVLRDIYATGQYHFGTTARFPDEPKKIILHDIEPLLMTAGKDYVSNLIDTLDQY